MQGPWTAHPARTVFPSCVIYPACGLPHEPYYALTQTSPCMPVVTTWRAESNTRHQGHCSFLWQLCRTVCTHANIVRHAWRQVSRTVFAPHRVIARVLAATGFAPGARSTAFSSTEPSDLLMPSGCCASHSNGQKWRTCFRAKRKDTLPTVRSAAASSASPTPAFSLACTTSLSPH